MGGSEGRCRAWTNCNSPYYCCGCDERSFLPTAPVNVKVTEAYSRCPNLISNNHGGNSFQLPTLPLCASLKQTSITAQPPGRWLLSSEPSSDGTVCSKDSKSNEFQQHGSSSSSSLGSSPDMQPSRWATASGDPCIVNSHKGEEGGHRHYFYAPYTCKYHFFTGSEARTCLAATNRSHLHFQGDSMSRDFFSSVSRYLGVSALSEKEVKKLTNEKHQRHIRLGSNETFLTESYYWHFSAEAMSLLAPDSSLFPDVVITNNAMAHRNDFLQSYLEVLAKLEDPFWSSYLDDKSTISALRATLYKKKSDLLVLYQSARELHGRRNHGIDCAYSGNIFRECSTIMRNRYKSWQELARRNDLPIRFKELDEYQVTQGRLESYRNDADGWHFHLESTQRQMEIIILFNIICDTYLLERY